MLAGNQRDALLRVADRLSVELGYTESAKPLDAPQRKPREVGAGAGLSREDENLVAGLRLGLAKVAAALGGEGVGRSPSSAVKIPLDIAEMTIRGELVAGNAGRLPALMPGLVFLVTLPVVDQDRALELSRKTEQLIGEELGGA